MSSPAYSCLCWYDSVYCICWDHQTFPYQESYEIILAPLAKIRVLRIRWEGNADFLETLIRFRNLSDKKLEICSNMILRFCIIIQVSCNSCRYLPAEVTFLVYVPNIYEVNREPFFCLPCGHMISCLFSSLGGSYSLHSSSKQVNVGVKTFKKNNGLTSKYNH